MEKSVNNNKSKGGGIEMSEETDSYEKREDFVTGYISAGKHIAPRS